MPLLHFLETKKLSCDFCFLDSGTGGLPYMDYLKALYPEYTCEYLADTENFPYGTKTKDEIITLAKASVNKAISLYNPKVIVLACNTMTVTALDSLRKTFNLPFVGTVPAIKLASKLSKNRRIGLLATKQTCNSPYTKKLIKDFADDCFIFNREDTELIDFIEKKYMQKKTSQKEIRKAIAPSVEYFLNSKVDVVILGCTHFVHLYDYFANALGKDVKLVDSREGVVNQAMRLINN
jgi:glutamate racemase